MDKKILLFQVGEPECETVTFQKQDIKVKKHLSMDDIVKLVLLYVQEYFDVSETNQQIVFAEYFFKSNIFELVTDYTIQTEQFNEIMSSNLLDEVMSKVDNVNEAREIILKTIQKMEKENSFDAKLGSLADKATEILNKLSEVDFDKDVLESLTNTLKDAKKLVDKEEAKIYGEEG